ncbi:MAG: phospholipid-binding protein MlaC [Nitrincola lacisaponensis]|uniref:Putative ABC transporter, auxiliary component YrbC n=1 Tax=Nitrincola lacisaponensis TaxID=267850 RepID=A0A063Y388_9GAMM|nr:ABC transporter substrate-binding protein [Nitrincola lacisaponensis]KDE40783.1 putative ABC transporter, auxiliary component YrbC [Nitrincola lacisaponensis]
MKKLHTAGWVFLLSMLMSLKALAVEPEWEAARKVVEETTEKVIELMEDRSLLQDENRARLQAEVESLVSPVIDFYGFGRGVMGRFARSATEEELQRFADVLKTTLIRTYSLAVSEFAVREYNITPPRAPSPQPDMQVVNVQLTSTAGKTYNILYYMRNIDGNWMLVNVAVEGINLRLTFQNQFADMYQRSRSVSAVIDNWEERVASTIAEVVEDVEG